MNDRKPEPGEWPIANKREQLEALAGLKLPEAEKKQQESLPTATELLGRQAWSLKCLIQEIRSTAEALSEAGRRVNATLAVRHLEDALHRINLALPDDGQA